MRFLISKTRPTYRSVWFGAVGIITLAMIELLILFVLMFHTAV